MFFLERGVIENGSKTMNTGRVIPMFLQHGVFSMITCGNRTFFQAGSSAVHDTVVNQLLAKLDGVEQLNNILVIGKCATFVPFPSL